MASRGTSSDDKKRANCVAGEREVSFVTQTRGRGRNVSRSNGSRLANFVKLGLQASPPVAVRSPILRHTLESLVFVCWSHLKFWGRDKEGDKPHQGLARLRHSSVPHLLKCFPPHNDGQVGCSLSLSELVGYSKSLLSSSFSHKGSILSPSLSPPSLTLPDHEHSQRGGREPYTSVVRRRGGGGVLMIFGF